MLLADGHATGVSSCIPVDAATRYTFAGCPLPLLFDDVGDGRSATTTSARLDASPFATVMNEAWSFVRFMPGSHRNRRIDASLDSS